jgi:hypothetical protein
MTTLERLTRQLEQARIIGDRAAVTMLTARIRRIRAAAIVGCPRCGSEYHLLCNREPWSELEMRYAAGDR